ncbi:uncharacterized protein LOC143214885 isoform X4 [Lasioglossum baleicum]|uniref:uncharacterized protein LOC143214885 isoform X4 n=1 Tax=Lasioglossum baleicum TaxID=434251 RepID=UPI003FCD4F5E
MDCAPCMLNARSAVASTIVRENMLSLVVGLTLCLFTDFGLGVFLVSDKDEDRCDEIMEKVASEDRGITTDDSPTRLQSIWLSQQCETRAGPEHVIRKYSFFANGTFLLIRYHYAEESCSIATYAVVARGSIELSSPSIRISGATETNARLDSVHLIPFNRQVARRFRRRINATCAVDDTEEIKWRPYRAEPIYKRPIHVPADMNVNLHGPSSNSFESRSRRTKNRDAFDCLEMLNIEFAELGLLRVEKRRSRVELLLGGSLRSTRLSETFGTRTPSRLQSLALLRADTVIMTITICISCFLSNLRERVARHTVQSAAVSSGSDAPGGDRRSLGERQVRERRQRLLGQKNLSDLFQRESLVRALDVLHRFRVFDSVVRGYGNRHLRANQTAPFAIT